MRTVKKLPLSCVLAAKLERTVLDSLGDVLGADLVAARKVGNGAGNLENTVITTGRHAKCVKRLFHKVGAVLVQLAERAQLRGLHIGVAASRCAAVACVLDVSCCIDSGLRRIEVN